jgi:hypothetical protein
MSIPIYVDAHSGYKANERPRQFVLDDDIYEIAVVLDQWYEPAAMYFKGDRRPEDVSVAVRPNR